MENKVRDKNHEIAIKINKDKRTKLYIRIFYCINDLEKDGFI